MLRSARMIEAALPLFVLLAASSAFAQAGGADDRRFYPVDTPFYTMNGPESPLVALIQTGDEVEYIGDYLDLDLDRAAMVLRMVRYVDFDVSALLVVNAGWTDGLMIRVRSVYELAGQLHVEIMSANTPDDYRDSEFAGGGAANRITPSLVTVLPAFQGDLVVHVFPGDWAVGGDLRGVHLYVVQEETTGED